jgi:TonB family protein
MVRRRLVSFLIVFSVLFMVSVQVYGQGAAAKLPKDPQDILKMALAANGLGASASVKPWHLTARYQTYDSKGKPKAQGTFEEWWAGPEKYKTAYSDPGFHQIEYRNSAGMFTTGDAGRPDEARAMVERMLVHPIATASEIEKRKYVAQDSKDGSVRMKCIGPEGLVAPVYCIDARSAVLRVEIPRYGRVVTFDSIAQGNGVNVAQQIHEQRYRKPFMDVAVTKIEGLGEAEDVLFAAPAGAVKAPALPVSVPGKVMAKYKLSGKEPETPPIARAAHVFGTVVLSVVITRAGEVRDVDVESGPPMLVYGAMDAVKKWTYKPYVVNGQPVDVETEVDVNFR